MLLDRLLEKNLLPDMLIRLGIRRLNNGRLRRFAAQSSEEQQREFMQLVEELRKSDIAYATKEANEQHYELPPAFFELCLGKHLKYSSCYWEPNITNLDDAERRMLELTVDRAEITNGQSILELGCGWGSLTLFMAENFPNSKITAVSNSKPQREYIQSQLKARNLKNVQVITKDMNVFKTQKKFQRIVSVEMFEHMRNYEALFAKVRSWLAPKGKLFIHVFNHREQAYLFESEGPSDWMGRYFFTGGIMPSRNLYLHFAPPLQIEKMWVVDGVHYQRTSEAWLENMDANRERIRPILENVYGVDQATKWWAYWRIFYMAVAELFGARGGKEWEVTHYLFRK